MGATTYYPYCMKELLKDYDVQQVNNFIAYVARIKAQKKKDGSLANPWASNLPDHVYAQMFKKVHAEGLVLDGKHITIQSTGVSYDYIAYKNKMLLVYPETLLDMQIVYEGDSFDVVKDSGRVKYSHTIANPFIQDDSKVVGAYCVIKNNRGEFITILSKTEIEKHRKVAKGDSFWQAWYKDMVLKTVIKKACKVHFDDVFASIEEEDNKQNDLEQPIDIELEWKQEVEAINNLDELREYYIARQGRGASFVKIVTARKQVLIDAEKNENA